VKVFPEPGGLQIADPIGPEEDDDVAPAVAETSAGLGRLTSKTTRNEPTPATNRFTINQNVLLGGTLSECWTI
jgi:hypothetical protein